MKSLRQNILVLVIVFCFPGIGFVKTFGKMQTKTTVKPNSPATQKTEKTSVKAKAASKSSAVTPKTKNSAKSNSATKTAGAEKAKPNSVAKKQSAGDAKKTTSGSKAERQIIVNVTSGRVRSEPNSNSAVLKSLNLGTILQISDTKSGWYQVKLADSSSGWISGTIVTDLSAAARGEIYKKIADKYFKGKAMDFTTAAQVFDFLKSIPSDIGNELSADLSFKRLLALDAALKKIPLEKKDENPYKNFLAANKKEIVYSEPAGEFYVRSDEFWELHGQYKNLPVGEEIAWKAANNPLPGECEGYINCYLYALRVTDGEYLNFYPGGKYSKKALQNINSLFAPIVADSKEKTIYTAATDISDRAEFNRYLAELRTIISRVPLVEKSKTLQQINQLGEGYR